MHRGPQDNRTSMTNPPFPLLQTSPPSAWLVCSEGRRSRLRLSLRVPNGLSWRREGPREVGFSYLCVTELRLGAPAAASNAPHQVPPGGRVVLSGSCGHRSCFILAFHAGPRISRIQLTLEPLASRLGTPGGHPPLPSHSEELRGTWHKVGLGWTLAP